MLYQLEGKSKGWAKEHETACQDKPQGEGMGLAEIAVKGGEEADPDQKGDRYCHRGNHAPQGGRDDPGKSGKGCREKRTYQGRLNKKHDEQPPAG